MDISRVSPTKGGTYNARDSGARAHDASHPGVQDHTGQATLLVPLLSAYPSYVEDSKVGEEKNGSARFHLPLGNE